MEIKKVQREPRITTIDYIDFGEAFLYEDKLYMRTYCGNFNKVEAPIKLDTRGEDTHIVCVNLSNGDLVQLPYDVECTPTHATISYSV